MQHLIGHNQELVGRYLEESLLHPRQEWIQSILHSLLHRQRIASLIPQVFLLQILQNLLLFLRLDSSL